MQRLGQQCRAARCSRLLQSCSHLLRSCSRLLPGHREAAGETGRHVVGGARELVLGGAERLPDDAMLRRAAELEGHPDNVAACLAGGFTMAWQEAGTTAQEVGTTLQQAGTTGGPALLTESLHLDVNKSIAAVVFVPETKSSTAKSRKLLPDSIPFEAAAANAARAALLSQALTRRPDLLFVATQDALHQSYRASAMSRSAASVSYTHLRAHETGRNLVCRL